jgi:hypothetical protein
MITKPSKPLNTQFYGRTVREEGEHEEGRGECVRGGEERGEGGKVEVEKMKNEIVVLSYHILYPKNWA